MTPAFSMVAASFGSSTTQITVASRPGSRHTRQSWPSATFPHSRQNVTRSLARTIVSARRFASSGAVFTTWKARRCADFGPMPGSRDSSSMRSWIGPSYTLRADLLHLFDLRAQLLLQPGHGVLVGRRGLVVFDERRVDQGFARHAPDPRPDPEHVG